jgi:hypothetical protein
MLTIVTVYNPHANHDNPALVPRVEPGKATTPDTTKPPAAPPLEKKIPPLPQRAAFPPKDGPISCPIKAGAAPAAGTPPTKTQASRSAPLRKMRQPS